MLAANARCKSLGSSRQVLCVSHTTARCCARQPLLFCIYARVRVHAASIVQALPLRRLRALLSAFARCTSVTRHMSCPDCWHPKTI